MAQRHINKVLGLVFCLFLAGCACMHGYPPFKAQNLNEKLKSGLYRQKVDTFLIIFDASASMSGYINGWNKLDLAKVTVRRMNQTIPELKVASGFRTFGPALDPENRETALLYGMTDYSKDDLSNAVNGINLPGGLTPMAEAVYAARSDLEHIAGDIAVIIISDGEETGRSSVRAAEELKNEIGERLCLYTVQVGDSAAGKEVMDGIAKVGTCGVAVNAADIFSDAGMADFVEKVFLKGEMDSDGDGVNDSRDRCPNTPRGTEVDRNGCPMAVSVPTEPPVMEKHEKDSDNDGVFDSVDKCPHTPSGAKVNREGCWILYPVFFDFDKWNIKPSESATLEEIVAVMQRNKYLKIEFQGHTDSIGTESYNQKLSEKRAQAVLDYFRNKGISLDRLTLKGYGESRPAVSNDTSLGRAKNRRVEMFPSNE